MKDLVRIYYFNKFTGNGNHLAVPLDDNVRTHIRNDLFNLDGGPGEDSYTFSNAATRKTPRAVRKGAPPNIPGPKTPCTIWATTWAGC